MISWFTSSTWNGLYRNVVSNPYDVFLPYNMRGWMLILFLQRMWIEHVSYKHFLFCCREERKSFKFGTARGWVNDDRSFQFHFRQNCHFKSLFKHLGLLVPSHDCQKISTSHYAYARTLSVFPKRKDAHTERKRRIITRRASSLFILARWAVLFRLHCLRSFKAA